MKKIDVPVYRRAVRIEGADEQMPRKLYAIEASDSMDASMALIEGYALNGKTANLYAAAEEMRVVLRRAVQVLQDNNLRGWVWTDAKRALAKAAGRYPRPHGPARKRI